MTSHSSIKREIMDLLLKEHLRLTPIHLERAVCSKIPTTTKRKVRGAVKELLASGQLAYTQHFSTTHIEINYNCPVKISPRILLSPPHHKDISNLNQIVIRLNSGPSFGGGDHPTTRMLLRGLDDLFGSIGPFSQVLDIGTGTGVLAIAASALGADHVEGIDIDPIACHEAIQNVDHNGLEKTVKISSSPLSDFQGNRFDLILANLRPPTIRQLIPEMERVSSSHTVWMISGCRPIEKNNLINQLPFGSFEILWQEDLANWSALATKIDFGREQG